MTTDEIELHDLRRSCYHEFGHAVVARHFGVAAEVRLYRTRNHGPEEKYWSGQCGIHWEGAPDQQRVMVALAGECAVAVLDEEDVSPYDVLNDPNALSRTDAGLAGDYSIADVEVALDLVRSLWPTIVHEAERWYEFAIADGNDVIICREDQRE